MRKKIASMLCCGFLFLLAGCGGGGGNGGTGGNGGNGGGTELPPDPPSPPDITYYTNPVFEPVFADPTAIRIQAIGTATASLCALHLFPLSVRRILQSGSM